MAFLEVNKLYISDSPRGPTTVFGINYGMYPWSYPNGNVAQQPHTWHTCPIPQIGPGARFVNLNTMFVGGVGPGKPGFRVHLDIRAPVNLPDGHDWSDTGNQGDVYYQFELANHRDAFGGLWRPCANGAVAVRWQVQDVFGSPFGVNIWAQGYAT